MEKGLQRGRRKLWGMKHMFAVLIVVIASLLFFFLFILKYSWFTKLGQFLVYSRVIQSHMYVIYVIIYIHDSVIYMNQLYIHDSVIYTHRYIYIPFQILFSYRLLQDIEYSFLCYIVGFYWLSFIYNSVYIKIPNS